MPSSCPPPGATLPRSAFLTPALLSGRLRAESHATLNVCETLWHYATAQGLLVALFVQRLPDWLR